MTLYRVTDRAGAQYEVDTLCEQGDLMPVEDAMTRAEWEATIDEHSTHIANRHLFCKAHSSLAPTELSQCKEAYYRHYSIPCDLVPFTIILAAAVGEETP